MHNLVDLSGKPFHFIGVGGIGMSALAYVVAKRQLPVSGSDIRSTHITRGLQAAGVHIFIGQHATNLDFFQSVNTTISETITTSTRSINQIEAKLAGCSHRDSHLQTLEPAVLLPQVICSTAINPANSELKAALEKGCPVFHRSDLLAALIKDYKSIAVAGTHGKTTTSSLIGYMMLQANLDPTIVVGGEVNAWEGNARLGDSPYLVAEADESDGSLAKLSAAIGVITNIELDHPDHYASLEDVIATFETFRQQCDTVVGCIDCETVRDRLRPEITYSLSRESNADYSADCVSYGAEGTIARIWEKGTILGELRLKLLGEHNLKNALAAVAVGRLLGLSFEAIAQGIATFEGAKRRFEYRGESNGVCFIDDYAHHPSELQATLSAARLQVSQKDSVLGINNKARKRVVAIFQPHRYSRTLTFLEEFASSFNDADVVVLTDIYSAGEPDLGNISGQGVADAIAAHHPQVHYAGSVQAVAALLPEILQPGDLAMFLGAGNLNQIIPEVMAASQLPESSLSEAMT